MSKVSDADHEHGPPASSDRSLPSFTPIRDASRDSDKAESRTSDSLRKSWASQAGGDHEALSGGAGEPVSGSRTANQERDSHNASPSSSKHRIRQSGGFLLESAYHAAQLPKSILSRSHKASRDLKGKRKSEVADLIVPKRRLAGRQDQHRSSIGGSPLASEVKQDVAMDDGTHESRGNASAQSQRSGNLSSEHANVSEHREPVKPSMPRPVPPSVGLDTDPARIVNMALSLSEGRRRQVSGMRIVSGSTPDGRRVSTGPPVHLRSVGYGGGTGQYFNDQRRTSQNFAPRPISVSSAEQRPLSSVDQTDFGNSTAQGSQMLEDEQNSADYYVSPATFARVEKAKAHFELLYNFRRLLSHLPPLRPPTGGHGGSFHEQEGRAYNPLQYVRNRKLRFRERKPLESEDEGWHDIAQVRPWVDSVIASHVEKHVDADECVRLPEFSQRKLLDVDEEIDPLTTESPASSIPRASAHLAFKQRRPRSDWVTYPSDLLADAFWLEQGLNKTKIEDREGKKIYPPSTQLKFSGWGNRTPVHMPSLQEPTPPPEDGFNDSPALPQSAVPELPTFTSTAQGRKRSGRGKIRDSIISMPKNSSGSRDRRRLQQELEMTSSSGSSDNEVSRRGRKRNPSRWKPKKRGTEDDDELDGRTQNMTDSDQHRVGSSTGGSSGTHSKRPSVVDGSRLSKLISRTSSKPASLKQDTHRRSDSIRRSFEQARQQRSSFEETPVRTSGEYDTTAPSSPTAVGFPSIAINLSPPASRSPSPSKKPFQARMNPFRDRSNSKKRNGIDTTDFADISFGKSSRNASSDAGKVEIISEPPSRGSSLITRGTSPMTKRDSIVSNDSQTQREPPRSNTMSRISTKSSGSHPEHTSKIRGIFKGGRIAELVGNEVTRVGDFIWKRDVPGHHLSRNSTSTPSLNSMHASDSEDELPKANGHLFSTPPKAHAARFQPSADNSPEDGGFSSSHSHSTHSSGEKPHYHNNNLPSFTSPFQRDREQQEQQRDNIIPTPISSPPQQEGTDHIARPIASRSSRMDRLAPPKLVTTGPSRPGLERRDSYGFGRPLDLTGSTDASQVFNDALKGQLTGVPASELTREKTSTSGFSLAKDWNISDRNLPPPDGDGAVVTRRDIARTRALLLSSGIKAREINHRANAISNPPSKFLLDTLDPSNLTLRDVATLRVPKKEEHVVAARNLIASLTSQSASFKEILEKFTTQTTPELHTDLQALDDLVDNQLTPRVRTAADQAGELSTKLSTTSTLTMKGLNDVIDGAFRRRRRGPVRYLRRFGYALIEWTVVGLLWAIWLIVTVCRVCLGTVRALCHGIRWLLFL